MESRHILNEEQKRFEPIDTLCVFCNKRHSDKMNRNYFAPVFKVQDRTNIIVYNSVKFNRISIGIPRCTQCFVIHKKSGMNSWLISIGAGIVLIVSGFLMWGLYGIFSMIGFFVAAMIAPMFIEKMLIHKNGILTEREGAEREPFIQELVIGGWSLNQPSAK